MTPNEEQAIYERFTFNIIASAVNDYIRAVEIYRDTEGSAVDIDIINHSIAAHNAEVLEEWFEESAVFRYYMRIKPREFYGQLNHAIKNHKEYHYILPQQTKGVKLGGKHNKSN